jgi:hypothetical protein
VEAFRNALSDGDADETIVESAELDPGRRAEPVKKYIDELQHICMSLQPESRQNGLGLVRGDQTLPRVPALPHEKLWRLHQALQNRKIAPYEMERMRDAVLQYVKSPSCSPGGSEQASISDLLAFGEIRPPESPELEHKLAARTWPLLHSAMQDMEPGTLHTSHMAPPKRKTNYSSSSTLASQRALHVF